MMDALAQHIAGVFPTMVDVRRDLHQHPELGFEEVRTAAMVAARCRGLGLDVRTGVGKTGVVARLVGERPGRVVALRADMDALPIVEQNEHGFCSKESGKMHACGHDAHVAMLLGAATALAACGRSFAGELRFLFQPAEEGLGGAKAMIDDGALEGVDFIVGQHVAPALPTGMVGVAEGPAMAAADYFDIVVHGVGGHGAYPHLALDPIPVAAELVLALQTIVSRTVDPLSAAVLSLGTIEGGYRSNVIAPSVRLSGTMRTLDRELREALPKRLERIVRGVTEAHGARYELTQRMGYPVLVNPAEGVALLRSVVADVLGPGALRIEAPVMGAEDFAHYLERVPGCFYWLGARHPEKLQAHNLHHPSFDIDEGAMRIGAELLARGALRALASA